MAADRPAKNPRQSIEAKGRKLLAALAVAGAMAFVAVLAVRPLDSPDLGYHLAYGQAFLDTGRIVDHNSFIYTLPADASMPPGPGCWYDADGHYRFPNANWGSQVFMALAWRAGGPNGLCMLAAALVVGIFAVTLVTMRRLGVPWPLAAAGIMLAAVAANTRFTMRPEVLGYLLLAIQLAILSARRITWPAVAGLVAVQAVFVNCHSYFMLGLGLTTAVLAACLVAMRWEPLRPAHYRLSEGRLAGDSRRLGVALAGQAAACFANPWTWRLAALPVETLLFMRRNGIAGAGFGGPGRHPWSYIGEFFTPFEGAFAHTKTTYAFYAILAIAAVAVVLSVGWKRWGWVLIIAGAGAVSLTMRRNIAPAAVVIMPVALAAWCLAFRGMWRRRSALLRSRVAREGAGLLVVAAAFLCAGVVTQRFYFSGRGTARFGAGVSRLHLPLAAGEWVKDNAGGARIWTDYSSSSNVYYFGGQPDVDILTNTWAYPPDVMREVIEACEDWPAFDAAARRFAFDLAVFRADRTTTLLIGALAAGREWKPVNLSAKYVVFARASSPAEAITPETLDVSAFLARAAASDPVPASALHTAGLTLYHLGWLAQAERAFDAAVADDPSYHEAWNMKGYCLATLGSEEFALTGSRTKLLEARDCFGRALEISPGYKTARGNLSLVNKRLDQ
jgi:hypothetical protein